MSVTPPRGFTLVELLLALALMASILVGAFGALRVGVTAWARGEDAAEARHLERSLMHLLGRTLGGAYPYRGEGPGGEPPRLLFEGHADRVALVTTAPVVPGRIPIAFTAVSMGLDPGTPGLVVRQKALPNAAPFEAVDPVLTDETVTGVVFRYLRDTPGSWEASWDAAQEQVLPRAIEVAVTFVINGRLYERGPMVVPISMGGP